MLHARSSYADKWRQIEAGLSEPNRSRTQTRCGRVRPYRPCPTDFREHFIELGWQDIAEHYATNWRVIARWIDESGREDLRTARAAYVAEHGKRWLHPAK
jgi:hypothetical protein